MKLFVNKKFNRASVLNFITVVGGDILYKILLFMITTGLVFAIISPIVGLVLRGFMHRQDMANPLVYMIPVNFTTENFSLAIHFLKYWTTLARTAGVSAVVVILQTLVCACAGYGFARFNFPGRNILFALVIVTIVVPTQAIVTSLYMQFRFVDFLGLYPLVTGERGFSLLNTVWPLFILTAAGAGIRSGLFVFIFRQFFKNMPKELEESAFIDGANKFRTFYSIILPNAAPAIVTALIFTFVWQYNDVSYTTILLPNVELMSNMIAAFGNNAFGSALLGGAQDPAWVGLLVQTGVVLVIAPLILVYLFLQRAFIEGVERSGIVG